MKAKWCPGEPVRDSFAGVVFAISGQPKPRLRYVRCPVCNRRIRISWRSCGDGDCWHPTWAMHKPRTFQVKHLHKNGRK